MSLENAPCYNVPTKQESIEMDRTGGHHVPLDRFLIAHFDSADLSKSQRRILARLSLWEGVTITACLSKYGFLMLCVEGTLYKVSNNYAIFTIGKRGAIKGDMRYGWVRGTIKITGHLPQIRSHVDELEDLRNQTRRLAEINRRQA
jgi:hypothetical protein|tara:strand:- start:36 stop:473 length:438 start_codon:yes stop_codon:yes gene_type:complete